MFVGLVARFGPRLRVNQQLVQRLIGVRNYLSLVCTTLVSAFAPGVLAVFDSFIAARFDVHDSHASVHLRFPVAFLFVKGFVSHAQCLLLRWLLLHAAVFRVAFGLRFRPRPLFLWFVIIGALGFIWGL